jgi:hypothetical protein
MALSYTRMAAHYRPGLGCACMAMGDLDTSQTDRWLQSLTPEVRARLEADIQAIVSSMSPAEVAAIFPSTGLGLAEAIGPLITGILQTGAQVYSARESNQTAISIARSADRTQAAVAAANAAMTGQVSTSMSEAQIQANALASSNTVKVAAIWGGVAVLALAGGLAVYSITRKRSRK